MPCTKMHECQVDVLAVHSIWPANVLSYTTYPHTGTFPAICDDLVHFRLFLVMACLWLQLFSAKICQAMHILLFSSTDPLHHHLMDIIITLNIRLCMSIIKRTGSMMQQTFHLLIRALPGLLMPYASRFHPSLLPFIEYSWTGCGDGILELKVVFASYWHDFIWKRSGVTVW